MTINECTDDQIQITIKINNHHPTCQDRLLVDRLLRAVTSGL